MAANTFRFHRTSSGQSHHEGIFYALFMYMLGLPGSYIRYFKRNGSSLHGVKHQTKLLSYHP